MLIVWKLDRLGHSLGLIALQDGIDTTTTGGKLVFHIMASLAEFERDLISEGTAAGSKQILVLTQKVQ